MIILVKLALKRVFNSFQELGTFAYGFETPYYVCFQRLV
jgi:hypothetical protein